MDLTYAEDSTAEVDMNFVVTGKGTFVEIQGTAEAHPFSREEMNRFVTLAQQGIRKLIKVEKKLLGELFTNA
jgi:ribonuclease PH